VRNTIKSAIGGLSEVIFVKLLKEGMNKIDLILKNEIFQSPKITIFLCIKCKSVLYVRKFQTQASKQASIQANKQIK